MTVEFDVCHHWLDLKDDVRKRKKVGRYDLESCPEFILPPFYYDRTKDDQFKIRIKQRIGARIDSEDFKGFTISNRFLFGPDIQDYIVSVTFFLDGIEQMDES